MTSRMEASLASSMHSLSRPNAMPPCGGAPMSKAFRRYPNCLSASSCERPMASKTCSSSWRLYVRKLPPAKTPCSALCFQPFLTDCVYAAVTRPHMQHFKEGTVASQSRCALGQLEWAPNPLCRLHISRHNVAGLAIARELLGLRRSCLQSLRHYRPGHRRARGQS